MIIGEVNAGSEVTIIVTLCSEANQEHAEYEIQAVVNTGFGGHLTLPRSYIDSLDLKPMGVQEVTTAFGDTHIVNQFYARIIWDGHARNVCVLAIEGQPLVGTRLLSECDFYARIEDGGAVTILPL